MTQPKARNASLDCIDRKNKQASEIERKSRGGRPTKAALKALEQRILDVATHLFATQGFAGTSMEQVAAQCQAGKDTIYRRYSSKAELFAAVTQRARGDIMPELEQIAATPGSGLDVLRRFARALLAINLRPELLALNRVAMSEAVREGAVKPGDAADDPIMSLFSALVRAAQVEGALRDHDPLELAEQLLYATSIKPLLSAMLGNLKYSSAAAQDAYFESAWTLFMRGAQAV